MIEVLNVPWQLSCKGGLETWGIVSTAGEPTITNTTGEGFNQDFQAMCIAYRIILPTITIFIGLVNFGIRRHTRLLVQEVLEFARVNPQEAAGLKRKVGTGTMRQRSLLLRGLFCVLLGISSAMGYLVGNDFNSIPGIISVWCYVVQTMFMHINSLIAVRGSLQVALFWNAKVSPSLLSNSAAASSSMRSPNSSYSRREQTKRARMATNETEMWFMVIVVVTMVSLISMLMFSDGSNGRYVAVVCVIYSTGIVVSLYCIIIIAKCRSRVILAVSKAWLLYMVRKVKHQEQSTNLRIVLQHFLVDVSVGIVSILVYIGIIVSVTKNPSESKLVPMIVLHIVFALCQFFIMLVDMKKYIIKCNILGNVKLRCNGQVDALESTVATDLHRSTTQAVNSKGEDVESEGKSDKAKHSLKSERSTTRVCQTKSKHNNSERGISEIVSS